MHTRIGDWSKNYGRGDDDPIQAGKFMDKITNLLDITKKQRKWKKHQTSIQHKTCTGWYREQECWKKMGENSRSQQGCNAVSSGAMKKMDKTGRSEKSINSHLVMHDVVTN